VGPALERAQQRPGDEEAAVVQARLSVSASMRAPGGSVRPGGPIRPGGPGGPGSPGGGPGRPGGRLGGAQVQDLAREVPVVERLGGVEALVALQANEMRAGGLRERAGERGLAHAGVALEKQRAAQSKRKVAGRGQAVVGQISGGREKRRQVLGRRRLLVHGPHYALFLGRPARSCRCRLDL
jgi:hypothetical protein